MLRKKPTGHWIMSFWKKKKSILVGKILSFQKICLSFFGLEFFSKCPKKAWIIIYCYFSVSGLSSTMLCLLGQTLQGRRKVPNVPWYTVRQAKHSPREDFGKPGKVWRLQFWEKESSTCHWGWKKLHPQNFQMWNV